MIKILITLLFALSLKAATYDVNYRGMTLGEITDLSTIDSLYLKAKVTSRVARFLLGKDNLVYYGGEKPDIQKSKFKKDRKMMLYAFALSLKERPVFKKVKINDAKNITLACEGKACEFIYYKNDKVNGKGKILFDEQDDFVSITEEMSNFKIERQ